MKIEDKAPRLYKVNLSIRFFLLSVMVALQIRRRGSILFFFWGFPTNFILLQITPTKDEIFSIDTSYQVIEDFYYSEKGSEPNVK